MVCFTDFVFFIILLKLKIFCSPLCLILTCKLTIETVERSMYLQS